jgi:hypothetical protein
VRRSVVKRKVVELDPRSTIYLPLPISTEDFLPLKAAVGDRDRNLQLRLLAIGNGGETNIAVMIKGVEDALYAVRHAKAEPGKPCWLVHHDDGPMHEFPAVVDVANFLAFGDARFCKRSWITGRSEPGRIVGGELPEVKRKEAPETAPGGPRGRYLPMLGDRARE